MEPDQVNPGLHRPTSDSVPGASAAAGSDADPPRRTWHGLVDVAAGLFRDGPPVSPATPLRTGPPVTTGPSATVRPSGPTVATAPTGTTGRDRADSVYQEDSGARWEPIVVDRPVEPFEPVPPSGPSYRPDTVFDGWSSEHLTVRLASVRGYAHRFHGRPREDDVAVALHRPSGALVFAVADGVSAAEQPHIGATLACRAAVDFVLAQLDEVGGPEEVAWDRLADHAAWQLAEHAALIRGLPAADVAQAEQLLATTLLAGAAVRVRHGLDVTLVPVGDPGAWVLLDGRFTAVPGVAPAGGEEVASGAVVALPRRPRPAVVVRHRVLPDEVLLLGTDGFAGPFGDGTGKVGELFAEHLAAAPEPRALAHLLDFSRETFDDDRTLLAIWPRVVPGSPG
ncbi:protein phosphatase 2C domain-containing protein [Kitasatospora purpeofusca]|uniref:protein phosphatase 2C domain-containing protein n=1 Tax=Kitasatospora purpeofusca TaxID=67352 RepID=UPI0035DE5B7A